MDLLMSDMIENIQYRYNTLHKLACKMQKALRAALENNNDSNRQFVIDTIGEFCDFDASIFEYEMKQEFKKTEYKIQETALQIKKMLDDSKYSAMYGDDETKKKYDELNNIVNQFNIIKETT